MNGNMNRDDEGLPESIGGYDVKAKIDYLGPIVWTDTRRQHYVRSCEIESLVLDGPGLDSGPSSCRSSNSLMSFPRGSPPERR